MEYGDLVHIIWDFQQLESSSRDQMRDVLDLFLNNQMESNSTDDRVKITMDAFEKLA